MLRAWVSVMKLQCSMILGVTALCAAFTTKFDKRDFSSIASALLCDIGLQPVIGIIVLAAPRAKFPLSTG
jgi:hypothetical protein